jgi:isopentenyldiphosphate isomerase
MSFLNRPSFRLMSAVRSVIPSSSTEYFDVLTSSGSLTGEKKLRSLVHQDGDWHRSVHVWLYSAKHNSILLQKRAACKDSFPSRWDVSCAGHLSSGESSLQAALNELQEELGVEINQSKDKLQFLTSIPRTVISQQGRFIDNEWTDVYFLPCDLDVKQFKLQEEEVQEVKWTNLQVFREELKQDQNNGKGEFVPYPDLEKYEKEVFQLLENKLNEKNQ